MKAFIIARDRVSYTRQCLVSLLAADLEVFIVDHGSTYPPMLDWLKAVEGAGDPERVTVLLAGDARPRDLWANGTLAAHVKPDERFIVTDCDIVAPSGPDWVEHLGFLLDHNPDAVKAGCGLIATELPDHYEHAARVGEWEAKYRSISAMRRIPSPEGSLATDTWFHSASVDTTLALYRRLEPFALDPAVRTWNPLYLATHLSWYEDSANPSEELIWYRTHALPGSSHWLDPDHFERTPTHE